MRFTKEVIDQKLEQVPDNIREAVFSDTVSQTLVKIAQKYGLHIDQIGILEEETLYTMLGLQTSEQFFESLIGRMHISQSTALNLAQDVSSQIESSLRSAMESKVKEEATDRESILSEIENPSPTIQPISSSDYVNETPEPSESDDTVAQQFISGKLKETVNMPAKKAVTTPEKIVDPYREPLA